MAAPSILTASLTGISPLNIAAFLESDPTVEPVGAAVRGAVLVLIGLGLGRWWLRSQAPHPVEEHPGPRFPVVLAAVVAFLMGQALLAPIAIQTQDADPVTRLRRLLQLAMLALALSGAVALVTVRATGGRAADLGFRRDRPARAVGLVPVTYVSVALLVFGATWLRLAFYEWMEWEHPRQLAVETIERQDAIHSDYVLLAGVILVQPFLEEVLYRGVLMGFLLRHFRPGLAIVVNSLMFGFIHDAQRLEVFLLSLGLAWLYHRTRSLWAPTLMHVLHNGLTILLLITYGDPFHDAAS